MPDTSSLEEIVDLLNKYHVRATYGAVAAYLSRPATFLMSNLQREPRYSWIVNQDTLLPTGYDEAQKHVDLEVNKMVLKDGRHLREWLARKAALAAKSAG